MRMGDPKSCGPARVTLTKATSMQITPNNIFALQFKSILLMNNAALVIKSSKRSELFLSSNRKKYVYTAECLLLTRDRGEGKRLS